MKLLSTDLIPVRARDIDIFNHVNNSVYLTYMEEARWKWFLEQGFREKLKDGMAIVEARLAFKRPIVFPNNILIKTYLAEVGKTSFTVHHQLSLEEDPETLCTTADIKIVFFDLQTLKPILIPEFFREKF